jgi:hypothetical protein
VKKILPNFLCVGAQKAGTTTIHSLLQQNSRIFLPTKKEIHFFDVDCNYNLGVEFYIQHFLDAGDRKCIGEVSPEYLFYNYVPQRILEVLGKIKIIIILRQPVERAFSQFHFYRSLNVEHHENFLDAIRADSLTGGSFNYVNWFTPRYYLSKSQYFPQVKRYIDVFGTENVKVIFLEDLMSDRRKEVTEQLWDFLEVPACESSFTKTNVTRSHKNDAILNMLRKVNFVKTVLGKKIFTSLKGIIEEALVSYPDKLDDSLRRQLTERYFSSDITNLEQLLKKDLSFWKT